MKLPLLLALLVGAVSAFHLGAETPDSESPLGDETLPSNEETSGQEAKEAPCGELMALEEEEGGCGGDDVCEEEGAVESVSALDVVDKDFQCPKEEDTVKFEGSPGCETCHYTLVRQASTFRQAQTVCQHCYRGSLVSIHSLSFNYQILCLLRASNQAQTWIGGEMVGWGPCKHYHWVDGSCWNFAYWAPGEPQVCHGNCVSLCAQGGHWHQTCCEQKLPFVCLY